MPLGALAGHFLNHVGGKWVDFVHPFRMRWSGPVPG
jgi:hypothetical protein